MSESEKCINFIINNGWKLESNNDKRKCNLYTKKDNLSIEFNFEIKKVTFYDDIMEIFICRFNIEALKYIIEELLK